ncbi:Fe-S cluster assembly ATPase SufC [Fluviispira multicolorata]|uniref:Fe-S cluster assembly ATPase SufC n=1 Tax=Fluviispira multicolorata TaxID=2654512 RepID=A0A833N4J9_9BACT|nr:Fe-S cluster assembly ATPase SufC [Fluviispira multicolorata]KAB8032091.1 Fe-S cluster assembly ATPase SufC [Fluviispira multicolorata]
MLSIKNVKASVGDKEILKGIDLEIPAGEIHVIMGPNGVGKSTLGHVIMGSKNYTLNTGKILIDGEDITGLDTAERAKKGLFLAFQYPVSIPGLKISEYLRNLYNLRHSKQVSVSEFRKILKSKLELLNIERASLQRYLNDGFSGGEMKRFEMLQLMLIEPKVAILDEIDSGVDVDAQKIVAESIKHIAKEIGTSFIIVTHYQRLLNFINPDKIHVILDGKINQSGDMSLVEELEREGYEYIRQPNSSSL